MKTFRLLMLFLLCSFHSWSGEIEVILDSANAAYARNDFQKAIGLYETITGKNYEAAELYFNLGNAYFKNNNIPKAILNYERAKKLKPDNEDIDFNLRMANQRTVDKIEALPTLLISEWKEGFVHLLSETAWSVLCIILLSMGLAFIAFYIISKKPALKQLWFAFSALFIITAIATFFIARSNYNASRNQGDAIIISTNITAKGSPNEKGTELFLLHEGTKINVVQNSGEWSEIKLSNGNTGWIPTASFEVI